jgi:hypothetical protein
MIDLLVRVVIDTNVWISALINPHGAPARLFQAIQEGRVQLVISPPLRGEVEEVVQRRRIRHRIRRDDREVAAFIDATCALALSMPTIEGMGYCRDPKDDLIVETAIVGGARYIVSRDEDLTRDLNLVDALRELGIDVLTVARFLELLDARPS